MKALVRYTMIAVVKGRKYPREQLIEGNKVGEYVLEISSALCCSQLLMCFSIVLAMTRRPQRLGYDINSPMLFTRAF